MPISILRLNHAPSSHPNPLISFIRPLPSLPTTERAETYLYAISAIVLPVMRTYHLSITTLEEHESNAEFVGRNFNNGEIVQLVLRNRNGGWLPFRQVQMVMMHELAHNVQMNHSRAFWAERNKFATDLKGLWGKGYTGDGLWGSGRSLDEMGIVEGNAVQIGGGGEGVENLCGGTYRSRRRKRKRGGQELTWREKKDRRIEKKFGRNGVALGEDENKRLMLEIGIKGPMGGKPRVAKSKRGRELRAAAALKRFGASQAEAISKKEEGTEDVSDQDEYEEDESAQGEIARDRSGQRLLDSMGFTMTRVCGDENEDDVNVKQEQEELEELGNVPRQNPSTDYKEHNADSPADTYDISPPRRKAKSPAQRQITVIGISDDESTPRRVKSLYQIPRYRGPSAAAPSEHSPTSPTSHRSQFPLPTRHEATGKSKSKASNICDMNGGPFVLATATTAAKSTPVKYEPNTVVPKSSPSKREPDTVKPEPPSPISKSKSTTPTPSKPRICPICSLSNLPSSHICEACSHVLQPLKVSGSWYCSSHAHLHCTGRKGGYCSAGDAKYCCMCGGKREDVGVKAEESN